MLGERERQQWADIERQWATEPHRPEPVRGRLPKLEEMPAAIAAVIWLALVAALLGAMIPGLVVAAATAAGWLLWGSRMPPARDPDALESDRPERPTGRRSGELLGARVASRSAEEELR